MPEDWIIFGNSTARGGASSPDDPLYDGAAVDVADTYYLQGDPQTNFASSGGVGIAPYLFDKLHDLGVTNPRVDMWALSGWSISDILLWTNSAWRKQNDAGLYPDGVFIVQATPNNTTQELLDTYEEELPIVLDAIDDAWPGIPIYVASGTSTDPDERPFWEELDLFKATTCAADADADGDADCIYVDIQNLDLDNTEHPTGGIGGGFYTIVENLAAEF